MADPTDTEQRLWDYVNQSQQKYAYFKVTAALSAVAFTVHITHEKSLDWSQLPYGVAILAWVVSAICGFKAIGLSTLIAMLNAENFASHRGATALLRGPVRDSLHLTSPADREQLLMERADRLNMLNGKLFDWNWWMLLLGGAAFLVGHLLMMAEN